MPHESCCRGKCSSWVSRGVTAWEVQECVTGGCCWLVGVQSSNRTAVAVAAYSHWKAQRCRGLISHLAVVCHLSFLPAWIKYLPCGAQFTSVAHMVLALLMLEVVDLSAF